ncbi:Ig-like domain-containing protein, partial [Aeromonas hydrophila]|uniref:Ig-like domain-containing protein n=1 Tax=Aeromonas hydrophila TaxID=644 RepID=UPI0022AF6F03
NNGVTDDNKPTLSGKADAGSTVTVKHGSTVVGAAVADASGNWSFTPSTALADDQYVFTVVATNKAGIVSPVSDGYTIVVDTVIAKPTITSVTDDVGTITGSIANNGVTDDNKPTLNGKAEAGSTITVKNGSTVIGSVVADASGNWSFTPSTALTEGKYVFTVTAVDKAGNSSVASDAFTITVDTSIAKPSITTATDDFGPVTGTITNNGTTDDSTPTLSGKAEAGATVVIKDGTTVLGSVQANASGNWTFTPSQALAVGKHTFSVVATDVAGNVSVVSDSYIVNIVSPKPSFSVLDDYGPEQGYLTNYGTTDDTVLSLHFTDVITGWYVLEVDGVKQTELFSAKLAKQGYSWSTGALSAGQHKISVTVWDGLGNLVQAYEDFNVSVTAPVPTVINTVTGDHGWITGSISNNSATSDTTPTLTGKALAGTRVRINDGNTELAIVEADSKGNWSFTPSKELTFGRHILTASSIDKDGNAISTSQSFTIIIGQMPNPPTLTELIDDVGPVTGKIGMGGDTDDSMLTLHGKADPGTTIVIHHGDRNNYDQTIGSTVADANGDWSYTCTTPMTHQGLNWFFVASVNPQGISSWPSTGLQYFYNPPAVLKEDIGVLSLVEDYSAIQPQAFGMEESPVLFAEHGSNGNDVIGIRDTSFTLINGGEGVDTVLLDGTNMTLDLDALVDRIHGIEKINLGEGTFNSLSLSADALEHLNPSTVSDDGKKQLLVNGDESSNVDLLDTLSEPWKQAGQAEIDGVAYRSYISGSVELLIEQNIQVTMT